ncbi:MAG: xanthine dehydrogenase family protein molybdopterin-binding subunit [Mesorhizobium sp.]|uniref:xanthine dehydrogenase family protein molybdopterin-binding subunit n=1 Tax=Mesorhizobium sp. TaxID=1871066 RepID=UPI000FE91979|nr:molybdopterin cofactor-binding domain-containing protein [Mesorhizobium sp.]RWC61924.1 MAG: xanthine dehydrogenase family protein molybdopterin-binding subunit [Mesorhizobium sp.]RWC63205.1 MAG: xanthine dehydrogenase family protein molybdopterin-binding subunit [Mesorhizobium sp.]
MAPRSRWRRRTLHACAQGKERRTSNPEYRRPSASVPFRHLAWTLGKEIERPSHRSRFRLRTTLPHNQERQWSETQVAASEIEDVSDKMRGVGRMSRRSFMVAASGLLLSAGARVWSRPGDPVLQSAWLRVAPDNTILIMISQSEMGQGISTTLPVALADELGADWSKVKTEWSQFDPAYRHPQYGWMFTGNSESSSTFYPIMRTMGAAAREMLVQAAAAQLKADAASLQVRDSSIIDPASGRSVSFGDVAENAARLPVPNSPALKPDSDLTMIGKPQPRRDIPPKVDGSAIFGIDVKMPGMAVAAIRRAPAQGGKLASYDKAGILARPGVIAAVEIASGLAVVADRYWTAKRALDEGGLVFAGGPLAGYSTEGQRADHMARLKTGDFAVKRSDGDAKARLADAPRTFEAIYEIPAQAHATMEPMNCTAYLTADHCELWVPTQGVEITQAVIKEMTGFSDSQIVINRTFLGGGFGRRLLADFVRIAVQLAKAVNRPVKVIWSREEDFAYDAYRPPMTHAVSAALGADGLPSAMMHRVVSPSHMLYVFPRSALQAPPPWDRPIAPPRDYDAMAVEGVHLPPYAIADYHVEQNYVETPLPVSVWRTTGHGPNNFVLETFLDELAHAAGKDPLDYRLALARNDPRAVTVLQAVAAMSAWGRPVPNGQGRGLALAKAFGGYAAQVVDVSVDGKDIHPLHVWTALDCGKTLDPGIAAANVEGGVVWGLSGLRTEVTFKDGAVRQTNFDSFDPVHLWETPKIETRFVESDAKIGGTGELGPVPTHAAFCNAVFAVVGERIRALPLTRHGYRLV